MSLKNLKQYEAYFYRAPSAHNTQPWILRYEDDVIFLHFDQERTLPAGDPTNRDLFLSLGAFVETVLIVGAHFGQGLEFISGLDPDRCSVGSFRRSTQIYSTPFTIEDIQNRQTSRLVYKEGGLDSQILEELRPQIRPFEIHGVKSKPLIDLFRISDDYIYHKIPVLKELRRWIRLSKKDPRYFKDGLNAECLGLDGLQAFLFDGILKSLESGFGQRLKADLLLTNSTYNIMEGNCDVLLLIGPSGGNPVALEGGRQLQKIWLSLSQKGYFTHPISQIIDCPKTYDLLQGRIHLEKSRQIFSIFRVGRSEKPTRSYRLIGKIRTFCISTGTSI